MDQREEHLGRVLINALHAETLVEAQLVLHRVPNWQPESQLDVHLLELYDLVQFVTTASGFDQHVAHTSLQGILDDLHGFIPDNVVAALRMHATSHILPYGIVQHVLDSNFLVDTNSVPALLYEYRWQQNSTAYHHMQQLLTGVLEALQALLDIPDLPDAMPAFLRALVNVEAAHGSHLCFRSQISALMQRAVEIAQQIMLASRATGQIHDHNVP